MNFYSNFSNFSIRYPLRISSLGSLYGNKAEDRSIRNENNNTSETQPSNEADKQTKSSSEVIEFLENQGIDKQSLYETLQRQREMNGLTKGKLLAMGFNEDEIKKYFHTRYLSAIGDTASGNEPFVLKSGIQINGRAVNSLDDLKFELFEAPIQTLMSKVEAGAITQNQIIEELQKLGATNIEEKPIENDPLGRTTITYTYRGKTNSLIPQNLTVVEPPKTDYDENGEAFVTCLDGNAYSREELIRGYGFRDNDLSRYFDKTNQKTGSDNNYYKLKSGIIIEGYEIKTIRDLYYFVVLARLK